MRARHRIENGGITVRALRDRCDETYGHLACVFKAGHAGWHLMDYPGRNEGRFYQFPATLEVLSL